MEIDKIESSEVLKRKKPLPFAGHLFFSLIGVMFVVGPSIALSLPRFDKCGFLLCMPPLIIVGILWFLVAMRSFTNRDSDYNKFHRSAAQSEGLVVHRYVDKRTYWDEGYREEDRYYHLVFEYDAKLSQTTTETYILDAQVMAPFYNRHDIGAKVLVHFAKEDPRLAYLDGEVMLFGRPMKDWKSLLVE